MTDALKQLDDPLMRVADGAFANLSTTEKFGRREGVTTDALIWNCDNASVALRTTAVTMYGVSEDDSAVGEFLIQGLGPDYTLQLGKVTLSGRSPQVAITDLDGGAITWLALIRAYQQSDGAANTPTDDVWFGLTSTLTLGKPLAATQELRLEYGGGTQQSEKAWFMIPSGKVGFIFAWNAFMAQSTGASRHARIRLAISELADGASVGAPLWAPSRTLSEFSISDAQVIGSRKFRAPIKVNELTIVEIRATASSSSELGAGFDILLADED